jgi:hypothetical protein
VATAIYARLPDRSLQAACRRAAWAKARIEYERESARLTAAAIEWLQRGGEPAELLRELAGSRDCFDGTGRPPG